ncbi:hypothetical protein HNY73_007490 [Argiope bruennichi]|nr:hypothetical protein HNY73_007490 [Argiope bruennichi]
MVKAYFTFGQRTVQPGCLHLYRTTDAPMLFYELDERYKHPDRVKDKRFHWHDQYDFKRFVWQPNSNYVVAEGTTYMIMSIQKTLFSVNIVSVRIWNDEGGLWKNPKTDTNLTGCCYRVEKRKRKNQSDVSKRTKMVDEAIEKYFPDSSAQQRQPVAMQVGDQVVQQRQMPIVIQIENTRIENELLK